MKVTSCGHEIGGPKYAYGNKWLCHKCWDKILENENEDN